MGLHLLPMAVAMVAGMISMVGPHMEVENMVRIRRARAVNLGLRLEAALPVDWLAVC